MSVEYSLGSPSFYKLTGESNSFCLTVLDKRFRRDPVYFASFLVVDKKTN